MLPNWLQQLAADCTEQERQSLKINNEPLCGHRERMMTHTEYAKRYNCTLAEAIADRDWPMTESECIACFFKEAGRKPTKAEVLDMRPDSDYSVRDAREEFDSMAADW